MATMRRPVPELQLIPEKCLDLCVVTKDLACVGRSNRPFEEERKQDKSYRYRGDCYPFPGPVQVQEKENEDHATEGKTIRTVGTVPHLKTHEVEFNSNTGRQKDQKQRIRLGQSQKHDACHVTDPYVLQRNRKKIAFEVRAGTSADAVVYFQSYSDAG
jgi:hypothetical protein